MKYKVKRELTDGGRNLSKNKIENGRIETAEQRKNSIYRFVSITEGSYNLIGQLTE
jgi:hypothetical protein